MKIFLVVILILLFFQVSCNNQDVNIIFVNPIDGDYISKKALIIIDFSSIKIVDNIKLLILGEDIKKEIEFEIKENRLYSYFPDDLPDGEYKIQLNYFVYKNLYKKEINVILNSEVPVWENFIYPTFIRAGKEIYLESLTSTKFKSVEVIFDDGSIIRLEYNKDKDSWINSITISHFISEGSHFVTFKGIDLKDEIIEERKVFTVINSDPVIYSPLNGLETTANEIDIFGFYEPDKEIEIYVNKVPIKRIKVNPSGDFFDTIFLLPGEYLIYAKELSSQFVTESSLQNINIKVFQEGIITLCYHNISDKGGNLYTITPKDFEDQIVYMKERGYKSISSNDLLNYYEKGFSLPKKSVLITFDDGFDGVYNFAYPILKKYGYNAIFFVITKRVGNTKNFVSWEELKEMVDSGVFEVGSHTFDSHKTYLVNGNFVSIIKEKGEKEDYETFKNRVIDDLRNSKELIEKNIGKEVIFFAYPYGEYSKDTIEFLREVGFKFAFTTFKGININTNNRYELKRYSVYRGTDIKQIIN